MPGYLNLVFRRRKTKILFLAQILVFASWIVLFLIGVPWSMSKPISDYPAHKYERPPGWASYYVINHGKPHFYRDSRKERPVTFWIYLSLFGVMYLLLLMSVAYVYKVNQEKFPGFKFMLYERDTT